MREHERCLICRKTLSDEGERKAGFCKEPCKPKWEENQKVIMRMEDHG